VQREGRPSKTSQFGQFTQEQRATEKGIGRETQKKLDALASRRPDLLAEVRAGRKSTHRAAIEAGIVKEKSPFEKIALLIERHYDDLTPEERQKLKELLSRPNLTLNVAA
jgi:hypothetical protein